MGESCRKLLEPPYVDGVDWGKWHVFWVDERVVLKTDPESNYKLAYDGFLSKVWKMFVTLLSYFHFVFFFGLIYDIMLLVIYNCLQVSQFIA